MVSPVNVIGAFAAAAAGHKLKGDGGITRDVFPQERHLRPHAQISRAAGRARLDDRNGLARVEGGLTEDRSRQHECRSKRRPGQDIKKNFLHPHREILSPPWFQVHMRDQAHCCR